MSDPSLELDPGLFRLEAIDPEVAAFNAEVEKALAQAPPIQEVDVALSRQAREEGRGLWGPPETVDAAEDRVIPGPAGELGIRVMIPDRRLEPS